MTWTLDDVVVQVRDVLQDSRAGNYRYSDARIIRHLNTTLSDVRRLRPDLFLPNIKKPLTLYTIADLGVAKPLPIDDMYFSACVDYIAGLVSMTDDEFVIDGRAVSLLNRFVQKLISRGA